MKKLRTCVLFLLTAAVLLLSIAPALAPVCRADAAGPVPSDTALPDSSGTPESSAAPEDAQSAISNPYGPYAMIWVSLIIGLICILIAAAVFFFSGRN